MKTLLVVFAVLVVLTGLAVPFANADLGAYIDSSKDKTIRGIEDGFFGMPGEIYHQINVRRSQGLFQGYALGAFHGLHRGVSRTLVGAYEVATMFHHDQPLMSDVDSLFIA